MIAISRVVGSQKFEYSHPRMEHTNHRGTALQMWGLIALTLAAFAPAWTAGWIDFDDNVLILDNPYIRDLAGVWRCWTDPTTPNQDYYPMTFSLWAIEYQLWGYKALGYHLVNVALHLGGVLVLWSILRRLRLYGAWMIAAIFSVHPVQVESVIWAVQTKATLSGLLGLTSAWFFLTFWLARENGTLKLDSSSVSGAPIADPPAAHAVWWRYGLSLVFFVLAMLSKPLVMTIAAGLVITMWWKRGGRFVANDVKLALPFFVLILPMAALTIWVQKHHIGTSTDAHALTLAERILVAGRALCFYASKLVLPINLGFAYEKWTIDTRIWWQWIYPVIAAAAVIGAWLNRRRLGAGLFAAIMFFIAMLSPSLGFISIYWFLFYYVCDHMQYLAVIAFAVLLVHGGGQWLMRRVSEKGRGITVLATIALFITLVGTTISRGLPYADGYTLWQDAIAQNELAWIPHNNLGFACEKRGEYENAVGHYRRALELERDSISPFESLVRLLHELGRSSEALALFPDRLARQPNSIKVLMMHALVLNGTGKTSEAREVYQRVIGMVKPEEIDLPGKKLDDRAVEWRMYATALLAVERYAEAERAFAQSAQLQPGDKQVHVQRARAILKLDRIQEACEELKLQASIDEPNDPRTTPRHLMMMSLVMSVSRDPTVHNLPVARRAAELAVQLTKQRVPRMLEALALVALAQGDSTTATNAFDLAERVAIEINQPSLINRITDRRARAGKGEKITLSGAEIVDH